MLFDYLLPEKLTCVFVCLFWGGGVHFESVIIKMLVFVFLQHEDASILMFDHLVDDNKLTPVMNEYGLITEGDNENDLVFIKEMIKGSVKNDPPLNEVFIVFLCECFEISQDYSWKKLCLMLLFWLRLHSSCIKVETMKNPFSMKLWQTNKME